MSIHQHGTLEDTMYFWFGANDTSGSGADGATPLFDVRLAGAAAGAIPVLSGTPTLLTHANFPAGAHEVAVAATVANGFAANATYSVFSTLLVDSQNPTGFIGSFTLTPLATSEEVNAIGSGATGGTHVEATYDNTTRDTIDNAGADLKGGGLVGIPVTGHSFVTGREITIAGSVAYNGAFEIISQTTNEVVITHAQTAEAFGGSETIVASIKGEIFVGTITSGTFADTVASNGDLHSMDDDTDVINIAYGFNIGGSRQATLVSIFANVNGNTDQIAVRAYNFVSTTIETKGIISGSGGSSFVELGSEFVSRNTGTGTEIGDVFVFFETLTSSPSSLDVDKCLLTAVGTNVLIGYPNGFEIAAGGTSGTEFGVNGTAGNPCPFADALTMNAATPLNLFFVHVGETITLTENIEGVALRGVGWTLVLDGFSISGSSFDGPDVSGIGTGAIEIHFDHTHFGNVTLDPCDCQNSVLEGTFTIGTAGDFKFEDCKSGVAGVSTPILDFGSALNASDVTMQNYGGGIDLRNMGAGTGSYNLSLGGDGQLIINANCSATSTIAIRGHFPVSGDSTAIAAITFSEDARFTRSRITGGDYAFDTDANGRMRIVDGTGTGELDTASGTVALRAATQTSIDNIEADTNELQVDWTDGGRLDLIQDIIAADTTTDIPTLINARTLATADYFLFGSDVVGTVNVVNTTTTNTDMVGTNSAALATVCTEARLAELDAGNLPADVDTLLGRITSTLFTGITSLAEWLGLIAGKQVGDATARTELRATGAGSGTFNETTDSGEAIRDRGDISWITATSVTVSDKTGFSLVSTGLDLVTAWTTDITGNITGNLSGSVGSVTTKTGFSVSATGLDLVLKSSTFALAMADAVLVRDVANVEDDFAKHSLAASILGPAHNFTISTNTVSLLNPSNDAAITRFTYALTTTASVDPVTGVT